MKFGAQLLHASRLQESNDDDDDDDDDDDLISAYHLSNKRLQKEMKPL